jgi:hypothetical protein
MSNNTVTLERLIAALQSSWSADTCFDASEWSTDNPARGQCVVSSLVVQEYFGGELMRYRVRISDHEEMHYCNTLPDGTILDATGQQYKTPVTLEILPIDLKGFANVREKRLADEGTRKRYELFSRRVAEKLKTSRIHD